MRKITKTSKRGMGTVEVVIIIAVLVAIALIFRNGLMSFAEKVMNYCFDDSKVTSALG